ncbi:MAG: oligopeptide/dipeptide ABC transporter ATP-binding protein [Candidatus Bathyarchaeia archaeon]
MSEALVVEDLKKYFPLYGGILRKKVGEIKAVDGVSFRIRKGETFALVGESGSGKTTVGKTIVRLYDPTSGTICLEGQDVTNLSQSELKSVRRNMQMVFQDPTSSLNPRKRVKEIVTAPLEIHRIGNKSERLARATELLLLVQLSEDYLHRYPYGLSGGEKQRVGLARALALNPRILVLDEPTSALDVSVQAKTLNLLTELQRKLSLTYMFISHNLVLVKNIATQVAVMYFGRLVELAVTEELFQFPSHPYTMTLLSAMSVVDTNVKLPASAELENVVDAGIDLSSLPVGCRFYARCVFRQKVCQEVYPELREIRKGHFVACHFAEDILKGHM